MTIEPLGSNVLIRPDAEKEQTKSGIIISRGIEDEPMFGTVVSAGEKCSIKAGLRVVFKKYSPDKVKIDGENYLLAEEDDIMGIIRDE